MTAVTNPSTLQGSKLDLIVQTGLLFNRSLDLESIVQVATDAGLQLSGAQFAAFFYNAVNAAGESHLLYALSGVPREKFALFPMPRNTLVFGPTFQGNAIVRSGDITRDPRYGQNAPHFGIPKGHLPVRSYLAVPVKSQSGEVLGGLVYGHEQADAFDQESEDLAATVAALAAIAIENARLRGQLTDRIADLTEAESRYNNASKRLGEFAAIIESSDDAILSKDLTGKITSWNPAATRILGYTSDEMVGASILRIIPEDLHADEAVILAKIRAGEHIDHFETVRLTKDGRRLDVSLSISPVRDHSGNVIGAAKILRDISARKALELSLLQAEKLAATGRVAATIAHEINNPLEAIVNLLFLAREQATDPSQAAYLTAAEGEVARVSHLAKQTLGYYRDPSAVVYSSLSEIAAEAIRIYEPRCKAADVNIESDLQPSPKIALRKGEIMQVISNLIANAIHAMPSGGTLSIALRCVTVPAEGVVLSVEDSGIGISAEQLPHIFDAFYTTRGNIGTGIGLFLARQFIEGHGGKIEVESRTGSTSHGTKMSIFLPLRSQYSAA
ncbi:MAG TPA: PAS domain S-box protein [Acidobacteriaceae bacterium]|jgi:PAS domain S-box-containing protein